MGDLDPGSMLGGLSGHARRRPTTTSSRRCTPTPVQNLIDQLGRLPGIGPKSAQRVAYHLLKVPEEDALALATAISRPRSGCGSARCATTWPRPSGARSAPIPGGTPRSCAWSRSHATSSPSSGPASSTAATTCCGGAINPMEGIGPDELKVARAARPDRRRRRHRGHPVHQPQPRGRGHGHVPRPPAHAARGPGDPDRQRPAGGRRPRVRRRAHPRSGARGPRDVEA